METKEENNRVDLFDVVKGIAIISIVIGHAMNGSENIGGISDYVRRFVYLYHIVIFVFVSGYFLKVNDPLPRTILKKCKSLYVPFVIWSIVSCVLNFICASLGILSSNYASLSYLGKGIVKSILFQNIGGFAAPLWFLQLLLVSIVLFEIILNVTKMINNNRTRLWITFFISIVLGIAWAFVLQNIEFIGQSGVKQYIHKFHLDIAFLMIPILALGLLIKELDILNKITMKSNAILCVLSCTTLVVIIMCTGWEIELSRNEIISPILFYFVSVIGIIFVITCGQLVCRTENIKRVLLFMGKGSLHIMAVHCIFLKLTDYAYGFIIGAPNEIMSKFPVAFPELRMLYIVISLIGSVLFVICRNKFVKQK